MLGINVTFLTESVLCILCLGRALLTDVTALGDLCAQCLWAWDEYFSLTVFSVFGLGMNIFLLSVQCLWAWDEYFFTDSVQCLWAWDEYFLLTVLSVFELGMNISH